MQSGLKIAETSFLRVIRSELEFTPNGSNTRKYMGRMSL